VTVLLDPPHQPDTDDQPACTGCGWDDPDELAPGPSGDPHCSDCRATFAGLEDDAEYRHYAYH
jgi:hypothetical protein